MADYRPVAIHVEDGLWHRATQDMETDLLLTPEACNIDDAKRTELYPELPEWVQGQELCKRCYPTEQ